MGQHRSNRSDPVQGRQVAFRASLVGETRKNYEPAITLAHAVPPDNSVFFPRRSFSLVLVVALMVTDWGLWVRASAESTNVVIGLLLPPEEAEAASLRDGVQLAVELANQASAHQISLVVRGRTGQWGADAVEAARMVLDDGAQGLIAPPNGAATHLALQVSGRTAVPVISLCSDSSVSLAGVPWMVRIAPTTIEEAKTLITGLDFKTSGPKRWAAVIPDGRVGREVAGDLRQSASTAGCELKS